MVQRTRKAFGILGAVVIALVFFIGAVPVFAETPAVVSTKAAERGLNTLSRLKTRGDSEINRRVSVLTHLIDVINGVKRLTTDQKTTLVSQVQDQVNSLTTLKTKIDSDTDIATLRTDVKSIVDSYKIFALYVPKMYIIVHADRLLNIADDMTLVSQKLQTRITDAKNAGKDTTSAQSFLDDRNAKIADAKTKAQEAIDTVLPLTPDGYPANRTILQSARTNLQTARRDLQTAIQDAQRIRQLLRQLGIQTNAKLTPEPTETEKPTTTP